MLSRLAFSSGSTANLQKICNVVQRSFSVTSVSLQEYKTASNMKDRLDASMSVAESQLAIRDWQHANEIYYGKDRDFVNFPVMRQAERGDAIRLGFIPDNWFQFLSTKLGVSGPYIFTLGLVNFLCSKEFFVLDHAGLEVFGFWTAVGILVYKLGGGVNTFLESQHSALRKHHYEKPKESAVAVFQEEIKLAGDAIACSDGYSHLYQAKKESVALQLEDEYRKRLLEVNGEVKRFLNYHVAKKNALQNYEHKHMVNWIMNNVSKGITPQQEQAALQACMATLKKLSTK